MEDVFLLGSFCLGAKIGGGGDGTSLAFFELSFQVLICGFENVEFLVEFLSELANF